MTHILQRTRAALLLLLLLGASLLHAQSPRGPVPLRAGLTPASGELRSASGAMLDLRRGVADSLPKTEWLKGGVLGALVFGVPSTLLWGELARFSDQGSGGLGGYLAGFAVGGGIGFFLGALVGGQFEK